MLVRLLLLALVPAAVPLGGCASAAAVPASPQRVERHLSAMGTELTVVVEAAERRAALAASERAVRAIEAVEARLSTWRDDSELARLNRAPVGEPVPLSPELTSELIAAADCRRRTGGAFDPGVGALVDAWGLRSGGREPADDELESAVAASGLRHLDLLLPAARGRSATAVRRHPGLRIEEGGFGKGAGLAAAAAALAPLVADGAAASLAAAEDEATTTSGAATIRAATVDLGGQLVFLGTPTEGSWTVAVADPERRDRALLVVAVDGGSLATSGNSERGIEVAGRHYGHLLDPAGGRPVPDFGSLTVWAADPLLADCLSTGLYVLGPDRALAWAAGEAGVEVLTVEPRQDGLPRVRTTAGLAERVEPLVAGLEVETVASAGAAGGSAPSAPEGDFGFSTRDGRSGRSSDEPRAAVAVPWEGRPAARSKTGMPEGRAGFRGEYR